MDYFQAKSDLEFIRSFQRDVNELWNIELRTRSDPNYQSTRDKVVRSVGRASKLSKRAGVYSVWTELPPAAYGGYAITVPVFETLVHDPTRNGVDKQHILDSITCTIGWCEERVPREFRKIINPFNWVFAIITYVLRLPFLLFKTAGFNTEKQRINFWVISSNFFFWVLWFSWRRIGSDLTKTIFEKLWVNSRPEANSLTRVPVDFRCAFKSSASRFVYGGIYVHR